MNPVATVDDIGRRVGLPRAPQRVVSLVPSITELVCDLGAAPRLVGATTFCTHPPEAVRSLVQVGGTKNPDCARIASLRPDLVFLDRDENRIEDFDRLEALGVATFVAQPKTIAQTVETVVRIGDVLGVAAAAAALAGELRVALAAAAHRDRASVTVFCPIWRNPWMSFNRETYAADLLRQCGAANVCDGEEKTYPRVDLSSIAAAQPEVVLLPDEPYLFEPAHFDQMAELDRTPAWIERRLYVVDGKAMFWYGKRTIAAIAMLRNLLGTD